MTILVQDTLTRPDTAGNATISNAAGWGTASDGNTWSASGSGGTGTAIYSIAGNTGKIVGGTNSTVACLSASTYGTVEVLARLSASNVGTAPVWAVVLRYSSLTSFYQAGINNGHFKIYKDMYASTLATVAFAVAANQNFWVRFRAVGSALSAKIWLDGNAEPAGWTLTATDTTHTTGQVGVTVGPASSTQSGSFDSFQANDTLGAGVALGRTLVGAGTLSGAISTPGHIALGRTLAGVGTLSASFALNATYLDYKTIIEPNLVAALNALGLLAQVQVLGPDTTAAADVWLTSAAADLAITLDGYVRHDFPSGAAAISSGGLETPARTLIGGIRAADPTGKPVLQGEMAFGGQGPGASVPLFSYGVEMADYGVQLARAGMAYLVAYLLDDDMHATEWGMWQITADTGRPRPWFFPWSLLTTTLVTGSVIYAPAQPPSNDFRMLAAHAPTGEWTIILVSRRSTAQTVEVSIPFAPAVTTGLQVYTYSEQTPLLVDTNGFPLSSGTLSVVLQRGFTTSIAANSVLVLTQMNIRSASPPPPPPPPGLPPPPPIGPVTITVTAVKRPPLEKRH